MIPQNVVRFHLLLRMLHWAIAVLLGLQLAVGLLVLAPMPNTAQKIPPLTGHVVVGLTIGVLMLVRLATRLATRKPPPATAGNAALNGLRRLTHGLFYVVVFSMVSTGIGGASLGNLFPVLFGSSGALPADFDTVPPLKGHAVFANVLMVLLALHLAGVIYHQFVLKDGLFARIWFGRAAAPSAAPPRGTR